MSLAAFGVDPDDPDLESTLLATARVCAHPLVESAIDNLLANAVEHNDSSQPEVQVACSRDRSAGEDIVTVRIEDDGPDIPEGDLAVLNRGYETPLEHASGLGLWLSDWIVRESGGDLEFRESGAGGTVVHLEFPAAPPDKQLEPTWNGPADRDP